MNGGPDPLGGLPREPEVREPEEARPERPRPPPTPTTYALLAVLLAFFASEAWMGGTESSTALFRMGSLLAPAVADGDFWRLGSYAFLHVGVAHFTMNAWALWVLMRPLEATYGAATALGLFAACALSGGATSAIVSHLRHSFIQAAGASGGIFGLFGATGALYFRLRHRLPREALRAATRAMILNLVLNLVLALVALSGAIPLDNAAHAGGLVGGALLGLVAPLPALGRQPWHGPARWLLLGAAFALAAMEGVAVARAVHPRPRALRTANVEATLPWFLVPVGAGVAASPISELHLGVARESAPLQEGGGEGRLSLGGRDWVRSRSEEGYQVLASADGAGRLVVAWSCGSEPCRPEAEQVAEQVAASMRRRR